MWLAALVGAAGLVALLLWWRWPRPEAPAAAAPLAAPMSTPVAASAPVIATPAGFPAFTVEQLRAEPPGSDWLVRWLAGETQVLVIEFPDLPAQGRALNRVAALVEKSGGARDRVLADAELLALIRASGDTEASFFLGHDYRATDLARFFTLAAAQHVALNADEQRLRVLLAQAHLLNEAQPGSFTGAEPGALVSFSAANPAAARPDERIDALRRASVMEHELSHGRFFTDTAYREHCGFFWRQLLTEPEREAWRRYLASQGYDRGNEELMINETQALLMHTPDTRDFNAAQLRWSDAELEGLRERFRLGLAR